MAKRKLPYVFRVPIPTCLLLERGRAPGAWWLATQACFLYAAFCPGDFIDRLSPDKNAW
jgi:hypothetical protein